MRLDHKAKRNALVALRGYGPSHGPGTDPERFYLTAAYPGANHGEINRAAFQFQLVILANMLVLN